MMDRLGAEEDMAAATAAAVGVATKPGAWVRSQWSRWERAAAGGRRAKGAATAANLGAVGIGMRVVERKNG
jgi:hypothetical protein